MTTIIFFKQPVTNDALAKPNGARQTAKGMTASRSQRRVYLSLVGAHRDGLHGTLKRSRCLPIVRGNESVR